MEHPVPPLGRSRRAGRVCFVTTWVALFVGVGVWESSAEAQTSTGGQRRAEIRYGGGKLQGFRKRGDPRRRALKGRRLRRTRPLRRPTLTAEKRGGPSRSSGAGAEKKAEGDKSVPYVYRASQSLTFSDVNEEMRKKSELKEAQATREAYTLKLKKRRGSATDLVRNVNRLRFNPHSRDPFKARVYGTTEKDTFRARAGIGALRSRFGSVEEGDDGSDSAWSLFDSPSRVRATPKAKREREAKKSGLTGTDRYQRMGRLQGVQVLVGGASSRAARYRTQQLSLKALLARSSPGLRQFLFGPFGSEEDELLPRSKELSQSVVHNLSRGRYTPMETFPPRPSTGGERLTTPPPNDPSSNDAAPPLPRTIRRDASPGGVENLPEDLPHFSARIATTPPRVSRVDRLPDSPRSRREDLPPLLVSEPVEGDVVRIPAYHVHPKVLPYYTAEFPYEGHYSIYPVPYLSHLGCDFYSGFYVRFGLLRSSLYSACSPYYLSGAGYRHAHRQSCGHHGGYHTYRLRNCRLCYDTPHELVIQRALLRETARIEDLALDLRPAELRFLEGWILFRDGEYEEAAEAFYNATLETPTSALSHLFLGIAWCAVGEVDRAEVAFGEALRCRDDVVSWRWDPVPHFGNERRYHVLVSGLERLTTISPGELEPWTALAVIRLLSEGGRDDQAEVRRILGELLAIEAGESDPWTQAIVRVVERWEVEPAESDRGREGERAAAASGVREWLRTPRCATVGTLSLGVH